MFICDYFANMYAIFKLIINAFEKDRIMNYHYAHGSMNTSISTLE